MTIFHGSMLSEARMIRSLLVKYETHSLNIAAVGPVCCELRPGLSFARNLEYDVEHSISKPRVHGKRAIVSATRHAVYDP